MKRIVIFALLILLIIGTVQASRIDEQKEKILEKARFSLLKQNDWLSLSRYLINIKSDEKEEMITAEALWITFFVAKEFAFLFFNKIREVVAVEAPFDDNSLEYYSVWGKGNKIFKIYWRKENTDWVPISVSKKKITEGQSLPKETIEKIIENGIRYYFMIRKAFGADEYWKLKELIEKEKTKKALVG